MSRLRRGLGQLGGKLGLAVCVAGFVVIFLGWNGAASFNDLRQQFPYLISGGIAGLGLVLVGCALLLVELVRRERTELQGAIEDLRVAIEASAGRGAGGGGRAPMLAVAEGMVVAGSSSYHAGGCRLVEGRLDLEVVPRDEARERGLAACRICAPDVDDYAAGSPTRRQLKAK